MKNPNIKNRKSVRLKGYDYTSSGYYFITINSKDHKHIFGEIKDKVMYTNKLGEIIQEEWIITGRIRENIKLHEYVVMPNHFHAILEICYSMNMDNSPGKFVTPANSLSSIVRAFKGAVTRRSKELKLGYESGIWHARFHDRIIRNERELLNKKNYILENVNRW